MLAEIADIGITDMLSMTEVDFVNPSERMYTITVAFAVWIG